MGELLPCPFCGNAPNPDPQNDDCPVPAGSRADGEFYLTIWCEACGAEGGKRLTRADAITAWNTRPRTEGRGEGQPVAWAYEYTNHLKGDRAPGGWLRAVAFEAPTRARVNAGFARNVRPLYASPIREPEISRTILGDPCTLEACPPGLFIADAYNTLGMKSEYRTEQGAIEAYIVESGEFFWGDNPQTVERQRAQIVRPISYADAILNLAHATHINEESQTNGS